MIRRAWCRLCFRLWMLLPLDWHATRPALWLLSFAGEHAHTTPDDRGATA